MCASSCEASLGRKKGLVVNKNTVTPGSIAAILLAASLGSPVFAQNSPAASSAPQTSAPQTSTTSTSTSGAATDSSTYATGQPLPEKSNEGFWGKVNPLARKKWVNRQVAPVKDRLNELDQLTAKNANDIKDVDSRAQAGIHQAQSTADAANQQAQQASTQAGQAQQLAQQANTQTSAAEYDGHQPRPVSTNYGYRTSLSFQPGRIERQGERGFGSGGHAVRRTKGVYR